ncbi:MAG: hypothetical protein N2Z59_00115, partial [Alteraurantiacibacter sp.]|nr:hypothetical protein [Alteraurantiacibacter sp.]
RLILLALAVDTGEPLLVATGGALGSGVALTVAGMAGKTWEECIPVRWLAVVLAVALMLAALVIGLSVRGLLG